MSHIWSQHIGWVGPFIFDSWAKFFMGQEKEWFFGNHEIKGFDIWTKSIQKQLRYERSTENLGWASQAIWSKYQRVWMWEFIQELPVAVEYCAHVLMSGWWLNHQSISPCPCWPLLTGESSLGTHRPILALTNPCQKRIGTQYTLV